MNQWEKGENGEWYYYGSDGASEIGWINVDGDDYYIDSDHQLAKSWMKQDGKWYYFDDSGKMKTGWQNIDGEDYYFYGDTGTMAPEWSQLDGKMYYFDDNGKMQTSWQNIDGEDYYFSNDKGQVESETYIKGTNGLWTYLDYTGKMVDSGIVEYQIWDLGKGWKARVDTDLSGAGGGTHIHVYHRKDEWAQNEDGTQHDKQRTRTGAPPNKVHEELKKRGWIGMTI